MERDGGRVVGGDRDVGIVSGAGDHSCTVGVDHEVVRDITRWCAVDSLLDDEWTVITE